MGTVQKYLNPITLEAKLFAQSLETLSETYGALDVHLVEALENVITSIEKFIDKNTSNEIVDTSNTKLAKCHGLENIQRIYYCSRCKRDLGKAIEKVAIHLAEKCNDRQQVDTIAKSLGRSIGKSEKVPPTRAERRQAAKCNAEAQKDRAFNAIFNKKKTIAFLSMDQTELCKFLNDFVQVGEKLKCLPDYNVIEKDIMELMRPEFPQQSLKMYKFGSRISGIGTRESDLDIYVDVGGENFTKFENRPTKEAMAPLYKLRKAMTLHRKSWKGMVFVESARVPVLKIIHTSTGIECDINLTNSLGYINSQLLEYIFGLQPLTQLLCIYMKKWLARTTLKTDFSTYSMSLMVIFYLQQMKLLPSISKFYKNVDMESALTVGPWIASFVRLNLKDLGLQLAEYSNVIPYIKGFFQFYLNFDYDTNVICPYVGEAIKKDKLHNHMPSRYLSYIADKKDVEIVLKKPMVVQDPIQLNNNVTKGFSDYNMRIFREMMIRSLELIQQNNKSKGAVPKNP